MTGQQISRYRVREKLGQGGMGTVYRADDTLLHRQVALKFLCGSLREQQSARSRFLREAQAAACIEHSNVCTIYDIADATPELVLVMALIEGRDLASRIAQGPLEVPEAIEIASQIADGLAAAHECGVVHRDIKPSNVIQTPTGQAVIVDFGLAATPDDSVTDANVGTTAYMSPQQLLGEPPDHRGDIWSLGVTLYELLSGCQPFCGAYEQTVCYSILNEQPPYLDRAPARLWAIVERALAKDQEERYSCAAEMAEELRAARTGDRNLETRVQAWQGRNRSKVHTGVFATAA